MKYRHLILTNLFRKKIRTALTVGSFAVALFLFGLLHVVHGAFSQGMDVAGADRLVVVNSVSIIQPLPLAYRDRLAAHARREAGDVRQLVRRRLPGRAELLPAVRYRPRRLPADVPGVRRPRRPVAGVPRRQGRRGRGRGPRGALQVEGRRPHPDHAAPSSRARGSSTSAASTAAAAAGRRQRSSGSAGTTSTSAGLSARAWSGGTRCGSPIPDDAVRVSKAIDERLRELALGDQDRHREGVRRLLREADGQHPAPDDDHRQRGVLHAPARDRQHDGHRGARAHPGAGGAEGGRLLGRLRAGAW